MRHIFVPAAAASKGSNLDSIFEKLWVEYLRLNPSVAFIHNKLAEREGVVSLSNDHIALRGFAVPGLGLKELAADFVAEGYFEAGNYEFPSKKVSAKHYEHADSSRPKVFVSELRVQDCSPSIQETLCEILEPLAGVVERDGPLCIVGRPWKIAKAQYDALVGESEYAAWTAAHGFRANHHTVSVNDLRTFSSLAEVNDFVSSLGIALNNSGGLIKGSPEEFLEQSSTRSESVTVDFEDQQALIPGCFYEFARRYPLQSGELYHGFISASADKIFESTDTTKQ